jgi:hypothetical protein
MDDRVVEVVEVVEGDTSMGWEVVVEEVAHDLVKPAEIREQLLRMVEEGNYRPCSHSGPAPAPSATTTYPPRYQPDQALLVRAWASTTMPPSTSRRSCRASSVRGSSPMPTRIRSAGSTRPPGVLR